MASTGAPPPEEPQAGAGAAAEEPVDQERWREEYWRRNLRLMTTLLIIWFVVSFVFGILLVEPLNNVVIGGFPLGFWFAQQGSIYVFVLLILVYALRMDKLDDEFGVSERDEGGRRSQ